MNALSLTFLLTTPWLVPIVLSPGPVRPIDHVPPSMAEMARRRLWQS